MKPKTTELVTASKRDDLPKIMDLLNQGFDIESKDRHGETALQWAVALGNKKVAKFLLDTGADSNSRNRYGQTPLLKACIKKRTDMIKMLLSYGADPNIEMPESEKFPPDSALRQCAEWGLLDAVVALLESGANINSANDYQLPAICQSILNTPEDPNQIRISQNKWDECTLLLIEKGADLAPWMEMVASYNF